MEKHVNQVEISTLINFNREMHTAFKSFVFALKDKWINQDVVTKFENNMKAAGKKLTVKKYDADHGFSNPSNAIYDKTATEDAYKNALEFFKAKLK